jgi:hypothetical protein
MMVVRYRFNGKIGDAPQSKQIHAYFCMRGPKQFLMASKVLLPPSLARANTIQNSPDITFAKKSVPML